MDIKSSCFQTRWLMSCTIQYVFTTCKKFLSGPYPGPCSQARSLQATIQRTTIHRSTLTVSLMTLGLKMAWCVGNDYSTYHYQKYKKKMVAIVAGPSLSLKVEISSHHLSWQAVWDQLRDLAPQCQEAAKKRKLLQIALILYRAIAEWRKVTMSRSALTSTFSAFLGHMTSRSRCRRSMQHRVAEVDPSELALCSDTDFSSSSRMNAYARLPGFGSDAVHCSTIKSWFRQISWYVLPSNDFSSSTPWSEHGVIGSGMLS